MLITDRIIYLELHKTACTHTTKIISSMYQDNVKIIGKHNLYDSISKDIIGNFEEKMKVGNIRNPWDWYVSLWSYGCQKKGGLYNRLASENKKHSILSKKVIKESIERSLGLILSQLNPNLWKELYSDPNNIENFHTWLRLILLTKNHSIGEGYKQSKISNFAGLLTYRYLKLYTHRRQFKNINSVDELIKYDFEENFMDHIIRNENLNNDLRELGRKLNYSEYTLINILRENQERTNKSERNRDYRRYYDDQSISLVSKYDNLIIKKYNYSFE